MSHLVATFKKIHSKEVESSKKRVIKSYSKQQLIDRHQIDLMDDEEAELAEMQLEASLDDAFNAEEYE